MIFDRTSPCSSLVNTSVPLKTKLRLQQNNTTLIACRTFYLSELAFCRFTQKAAISFHGHAVDQHKMYVSQRNHLHRRRIERWHKTLVQIWTDSEKGMRQINLLVWEPHHSIPNKYSEITKKKLLHKFSNCFISTKVNFK